MKQALLLIGIAVVATGCFGQATDTVSNQNENMNQAPQDSGVIIGSGEAEVVTETTVEETVQVTEETTTESSGITLAEVASHSSATDCWMAVEGIVYDVTEYVSSHPGGAQILQGCGTDATAIFNDRPGPSGAHSQSARAILREFEIGPLVP